MTLFIAGSETSSNALSWSLYLLARHPEVKQKLIEEITTVLGNQLPAFAHLPQLVYTTQVIQEAMRLYPPAWVIGRMALQDDMVDGYKIPKGSQVYMCTYVVHRHPDLWNNPEVFDPERFSPEKNKQRHKFAYFPFSGGPRLCIGNNFAIMEMTIALAMITRKYNLQLATDKPIELDQLITLRPKNGILMKIV
jgi:cytochrome P450